MHFLKREETFFAECIPLNFGFSVGANKCKDGVNIRLQAWYQDPDDCTMRLYCNGNDGTITTQPCQPANYHYNPHTDMCEDPASSSCSLQATDTTQSNGVETTFEPTTENSKLTSTSVPEVTVSESITTSSTSIESTTVTAASSAESPTVVTTSSASEGISTIDSMTTSNGDVTTQDTPTTTSGNL